jgi:hypothetical protein
MRYSTNFERDVRWFLRMRHKFNFDGTKDYFRPKTGEPLIQYDRKGVDGIRAFYEWDSRGKIVSTRHPNLLHTLLKTKGSTNLHIKMYAEDRASCNMNKIEFRALCISFGAPTWFREAVETQKLRYYRIPHYPTSTEGLRSYA